MKETYALLVVDAQNCFMEKNGSLCLEGDLSHVKESINSIITNTPSDIYRVVTMDGHTENDEEISDTPDFQTTFPRHAMLDTLYDKDGDIIGYTIPWDGQLINEAKCVLKGDKVLHMPDRNWNLREDIVHKTTILVKDKFDVFEGNRLADTVFSLLKRWRKVTRVVVVGVAFDICVAFAVQGLLDREFKVTVVTEATAALNVKRGMELIDEWSDKGVEFITAEEYIQGKIS